MKTIFLALLISGTAFADTPVAPAKKLVIAPFPKSEMSESEKLASKGIEKPKKKKKPGALFEVPPTCKMSTGTEKLCIPLHDKSCLCGKL